MIDKIGINILIDERIDIIDARISRAMFSTVEIPDEYNLRKYGEVFGTIRKKCNVKKFHFTDIDNVDVRNEVINEIEKMPVRVKMYIYYAYGVNESELKRRALTWTIKSAQASLKKRRNFKFLVEDATEYKGIIHNENLVNDDTLTIIPDVFCHVFAARLNSRNDQNVEWYEQLHDKICLETYWVNDKAVARNRREELLPIVREK